MKKIEVIDFGSAPLCVCGCGNRVERHKRFPRRWNKYVFGHGNKGKHTWNYGLTKYEHPSLAKMSIKFKGDKNPAKRPEVRKKISMKLKGKEFTEEQKIKMSNVKRKRLEENPEYSKKILSNLGSYGYFDWNFYNKYGIKKSNYPYNDIFNYKFKDKIRAMYNYTCPVTGITNEEHKQKYGKQMPIHHWTYNKDETNMFYFVPIDCSVHSMANTNKQEWLEMFWHIAEDKWCEFL